MRRARTRTVAGLAATVAGVIGLGFVMPGSAGSGTAAGRASVRAAHEGIENALPITCQAAAGACETVTGVLDGFPYPWATLGYHVEIHPRNGRWVGGRTDDGGVIQLYVEPDVTPGDVRSTFAHEIGHALHQACGERLLESWRDRRGLSPDVPLYVDPPHEYGSVAEDFAEAFRRYLGMGRSRSSLGEPLTEPWLQRNADLFVPGAC